MIHPPRVGRRRDFRAGFQRGNKHIDGRREKEDDEKDQEEVRPEQSSAPAPGYAAVTGEAGLAAGSGRRCCRHCYASFPRRLTLRRMKNAAIASIGAMNSDTDAPSGMSLPQIASVKAQVAKTWV